MFISAFIAGISGAVISTINSTTPYSGSDYLGWSFAITVLAGLGNIQGILISGIIIGIAKALTSSLFSDLGIEQSVGLIIMILVILYRPKGLFGKTTE